MAKAAESPTGVVVRGQRMLGGVSGAIPPWREVSEDPNAPAVLSANQRVLDATRAAPVGDRVAYLCELARDRRVLDVGVVEHRLESRSSNRWLHGRLAATAKECVGVDVLEHEAQALRDEGFDVRVHDLTVEPLAERFDVIVAGEVIEHVGAPEWLLANCRSMLDDGGRLVVTTPNPYALYRVWHALRGRHSDSADHVALLAPSHMLELGRRAGLELRQWRGVRLPGMRSLRGRTIGSMRRALAQGLFRVEADCDPLIFEYSA